MWVSVGVAVYMQAAATTERFRVKCKQFRETGQGSYNVQYLFNSYQKARSNEFHLQEGLHRGRLCLMVAESVLSTSRSVCVLEQLSISSVTQP